MGIWPIGSSTRPSGSCCGRVRAESLSDVATLSGVSRPTIYRYFASKDENSFDALGKRERRRLAAALDKATYRAVGVARLEAAVDVIAAFVEAQPPGRLLDLEPGFAHEQMTQALPALTEGLTVVLRRCAREDALATEVEPRDLAGAIARTALSHYIFPDTDRAAVRRQIRAAAGLSRWLSRLHPYTKNLLRNRRGTVSILVSARKRVDNTNQINTRRTPMFTRRFTVAAARTSLTAAAFGLVALGLAGTAGATSVDDTFLAHTAGGRNPAADRGPRHQRRARRLQGPRCGPLTPGGHQRGGPGDRPELQEREDVLRRCGVGLLPAVRHLDLTAKPRCGDPGRGPRTGTWATGVPSASH